MDHRDWFFLESVFLFHNIHVVKMRSRSVPALEQRDGGIQLATVVAKAGTWYRGK